MFNRRWTTITWAVMSKYRKLTYLLSKVIKSIVCLFTYNLEQYREHYHGPDTRAAIDDFSNYLKWEYKAGNTLDPYDTREKLWEFLNDRNVMF